MLTGAGRTLTWLSFNKPANISGPGGTSTFSYDADRARYKQVVTSGTQTTTTLYVGKLYEKRTSGFDTEHVNFIRAAGQVVATVTTEGFSDTVEYLHRDHLGSVVKVTDGSGAVIEGLSYDAFGKRRNSDGTNDPGDSQYGVARATTLSFTGHEQLDHIKLVHMNGRIYDPIIGRFLSPDPFVQFPESTQGLNRYTYVNNNPLSLTDPSGYFIGSLIGAVVTALFADDIAELLEDNWRTIAAVAIASVAPYAGLELGGTILAGFASGVVASGGDLEAGLIGAATAGAFYSVASAFPTEAAAGAPTPFGVKAGKVVLHGTVGGVSQELSGGKFGNGFLSAGFTQYAGQQGWIGGGSPASNVATSAMVGGTASALGGGKFANGAVTAAFARAFNDEGCHQQCKSEKGPSLIERFSDYLFDRFSFSLGGDAGYGTGVAGSLTVDGQTITDHTIQLQGEGGKVIGANARATFGFEIVKSGTLDSLYTTARGCAALACMALLH